MSALLQAAESTSAARARELRARLEEKLADSLTELLAVAAGALEREPSALQTALSARQEPSAFGDSKLAPWLFCLNARMQRCVQTEDAEAVELLLELTDVFEPHTSPAAEWQLWDEGTSAARGWRAVLGIGRHDGDEPWHGVELLTLDERSPELAELRGALQLLQSGAPALYAELEVLLAQLAVCEGQGFNGVCDPEAFGLGVIRRPRAHHHPLAYYLEQLIHCGAQLHWICLEADWTLLATRDPALIESPWNRQRISSYELLFQLFWLARALSAFHHLGKATTEPALLEKAAVLERGYRSVLELAESHLTNSLTSAGRTLLGELAQVA